MSDHRPLILTVCLDPESQDRFDSLRRAHFPPERNLRAAHVTLFQALPAAAADLVRADVADVARRAPFDIQVAGVRSLGRGVAYKLRSRELDALRAELADRWRDHLTRQHAQGLRARHRAEHPGMVGPCAGPEWCLTSRRPSSTCSSAHRTPVTPSRSQLTWD